MSIVYKSYDILAINGITWRVDIDDNEATSSPSPIPKFNTSSPGFELKYEGDTGNIYSESAIKGSRIDIHIEVGASDTALDTWLQSIVYAQEQRYTIKLYKNNAVEGVYPVLQDLNTYEDLLPYTFTLSGSDGLNKLQDINFDAAYFSSGTAILGDIITYALSFTGVNQLYGTTDDFLFSSLNWNEIYAAQVQSPLFETRINTTAVYKDLEKLENHTCFEIITNILNCFGARLQMTRGGFWITQPDNYEQNSFWVHVYTNLGSFSGMKRKFTFYPNINATIANNLIRETGATFAAKTALASSEVTFKAISGLVFTKTYNTSGITKTVTGLTNTNTYDFLLKMKLTYEILRQTILNQTKQAGLPAISLRITYVDAGTTYYLTEDVTAYDSHGNPTAYSDPHWTDNSNGTVFQVFAETTDASVTVTEEIELLIPAVGASGVSSITIEAYISEINTVCGQNLNWSGVFTLSQLNGNNETETDLAYKSANSIYPHSSLKFNTEVYYGDSPIALVSNAMQIYNGSAWVASSAWAIGLSAGSGVALAQLLANTAVTMQRKPKRIYQGSFIHGDTFDSIVTPVFYGKIWMFNAGSFSAQNSVCQGEWIEIERLTTGITDSTVVPYRKPSGVRPDIIQQILHAQRDHSKNIANLVAAKQLTQNSLNDIATQLGDTQPNLNNNCDALPSSPTPGERHALYMQWDDVSKSYFPTA